MRVPALLPAQAGLPEAVPDLIGAASVIVLLLLLTAIGGMAYRRFTGGIEWPEEQPEDPDPLRRGDEDDEWDYY